MHPGTPPCSSQYWASEPKFSQVEAAGRRDQGKAEDRGEIKTGWPVNGKREKEAGKEKRLWVLPEKGERK